MVFNELVIGELVEQVTHAYVLNTILATSRVATPQLLHMNLIDE